MSDKWLLDIFSQGCQRCLLFEKTPAFRDENLYSEAITAVFKLMFSSPLFAVAYWLKWRGVLCFQHRRELAFH